MSKNEVLVIDIGGTKTNVSFVYTDELGKIKITDSVIFKTHSNPEHAVQKISAICSEHGKSKSKGKNEKFSCISLSLPGRWDGNGILKESFFLHDWLEYPFVRNLASELKIKNYIWETDVICGALGEYHFVENLPHTTDLLYINLGTGVGAAFIKDGKPFKSDSGLTLRMQKLVVPFQEELYSGVDLISGGTLLQISQYDSIQALYEAYKSGVIEAIDLIAKAQTQLASWIINLFYLFAPDLIVLNGGLTYDWEVLCEEAINIVNEELEGQVKILPSKLRELAPIYGAYVNFMRHCK